MNYRKNMLSNLTKILRGAFTCSVKAPSMSARILRLSAELALQKQTTKILVGTHHKVLTVFMGRVFRAYSLLSRRSFSMGMGDTLDYQRNVLLDHHSHFNLDRFSEPFILLHFVRDPRDVVVSSMRYHQVSDEDWLHIPRKEFGGRSYQDKIRSLTSASQKLIFEMNQESGKTIMDMSNPSMTEVDCITLRYEKLVCPDGYLYFAEKLSSSDLKNSEINLLACLFRVFAYDGPLVNSAHVRDPRPSQWKEFFDPATAAEFEMLYGEELHRLGYE